MPSANKIDNAKFKEELEEYGRKFRLIRQTVSTDKSASKSSFNPRNKKAIIETYLNCLKETLLEIEIRCKKYNNPTKEERDALYSLRDDPTIIIL